MTRKTTPVLKPAGEKANRKFFVAGVPVTQEQELQPKEKVLGKNKKFSPAPEWTHYESIQFLYKLSDPEQIKLRMIWDLQCKIWEYMVAYFRIQEPAHFRKVHDQNFTHVETEMEQQQRVKLEALAKYSKLR